MSASEYPWVVRCVACDQPIHNPEETAYEESTNWAKRRSAGGQNQARLRRPTGRWMHDTCMELECAGVGANQLGLALS